MSLNPFFSIVIPALNEEAYLPDLLIDLTQQTNQDFSVIVVDGNSQDETVAAAEKFKSKLELEIEVVKKRNVSYQRNHGGRLAQGKWLIFMDADNKLPPYFLEGIKYKLSKNPQTDLFSCWAAVEDQTNKNYNFILNTSNLTLELLKVFDKPSVYGALLGIKRQLFTQFEFDEQQLVAEDCFLAEELVASGYEFSLFKDPRYYYNFRRLETEGRLKMAKSVALVQLRRLQGKDFKDHDYGYSMAGGQAYQEKLAASKNKKWSQSLPVFEKLQNLLKEASTKQQEKARTLFEKLKNQLELDNGIDNDF